MKFLKRKKSLLEKLSSMEPAFTYDDILLKPQYSEVKSRKDVNLYTNILGYHLAFPIISANMDTVTGFEMARVMGDLGSFGILHRYQSVEQTLKDLHNLTRGKVPSIGVDKRAFVTALEYVAAGAQGVCIDIAHGDSEHMLKLVERIAKEDIKIIAGNIATFEAAERLANAGASVLKVGIGPGSLCSTRVVTGHGVPQVTALLDVCKIKEKHPDIKIIADGGIRNSGDMVKALALGADAVMVGSLLAGTNEAPGKLTDTGKIYRGMASREAREDLDPSLTEYTPEGVAIVVKLKGPAANVINELVGGIKSGLSYSGARTLEELRQKAEFMRVTPSSYIEGTPHGKL